ncbi:MAG: peptidoglycan-associated lipoprotein Pal [Thermodesulfobacteriota bacterium]
MRGKIVQMLVLATLFIFVPTFMAGCGDKKVISEDMAQQTTEEKMEAEAEGGAGSQAAEGTERIMDTGETMGEPEPLQSEGDQSMKEGHAVSEGRTHAPMLPVYFDFDKSTIREDQVSRMRKNCEFMEDNPGLNIVIEGNCDERGTSEYNMALGQRRADSAKRYLVNLGIEEDRISTISYGEEKPLVHGHDEHAWTQNRRDDFKIR